MPSSLIDDLDDLDFINRVKIQQRNWIGRSEGTEVDFTATNGDKLTVYTTRCDTLFGVTYMVMSPEHEYLKAWKDQIENWDEVEAYQAEAARKSALGGEFAAQVAGHQIHGGLESAIVISVALGLDGGNGGNIEHGVFAVFN